MAFSWALHDVSPSSLRPGDHIYRWSSLVHVHHGIVLEKPEDNKDLFDGISVLHIPNNGGVEAKQDTLGAFLGKTNKGGGGSLKCARYGVPPIEVWIKRSGTCYAEQSSPVDEVVARALAFLQKSEQHCVIRAFNGATSEDIAFWCKTGKHRSAVPSGVGGTNYAQQQCKGSNEATQRALIRTETPSDNPEANNEETNAATRAAEEVEKGLQCVDPDAFLLLDESNTSQQQSTPQSVRCISVPSNDADLDGYEVVDLPPWLPVA